MKKIGMFFILLILLTPSLRAGDKLGPDGYLGRFSLSFESGLNFTGYKEEKPYPYNGYTFIVAKIDQEVNINSPFIKLGLLLPKDGITYFANFSTTWNKETRKWTSPSLQEDINYRQFSVSVGFKLYFK